MSKAFILLFSGSVARVLNFFQRYLYTIQTVLRLVFI